MSNYKEKIKIVRDILQGLTRLSNEFPKIDKKLKDSEMYLNLTIKDITDKYEQANRLHSEIVGEADEKDLDFYSYKNKDIFPELQRIYYQHSTMLHELLKVVLVSDRDDITFSEHSQSTFNRFSNQSYVNSTVAEVPFHNPVTNIAPFDGNYEKWQDFREDFIALVHQNNMFSDHTKLRMLQSVLKGDALRVIKREFGTLKGSEYQAIWSKLLNRYNNKRSLIDSHFAILFYQSAAEKETSANLKQIYDNTFDSIASLNSLGLPTDNWGDILLYLIHSKLPLHTREIWEEKIGMSDEQPKFTDFLKFVEARFRTLERLEATRKASTSFKVTVNTHTNQNISNRRNITLQTTNKSNFNNRNNTSSDFRKLSCKLCQGTDHHIRKCNQFLAKNIAERRKCVMDFNLCFNCLGGSHRSNECKSVGRCSKCNQRHHSDLHYDNNKFNGSSDVNVGASTSANTLLTQGTCNVLFPTALIRVKLRNGQSKVLRALLDSCSDACYITSDAVKQLNLNTTATILETSGLGDTVTNTIREKTQLKVQSIVNHEFSLIINAYILDTISSKRPTQSFKTSTALCNNIQLADPEFNVSNNIDMLLSGDIYAAIEMSGFMRANEHNIIFKETKLGWIVTGGIDAHNCLLTSVQPPNITLVDIDRTLRSFWEVENVESTTFLTDDESLADQIYSNTTKRLSNGKYSVALPFKNEVAEFKNMKTIALKRLEYLEKRLDKNKELKIQYHKALSEYVDLNYMTEVNSDHYPNGYYIPHHCVVKESSSTTKYRIVMDASAKDSNQISLNDCLLNGPKLQSDLLDLLIKFRIYKIALTADIAKMYMQILIHENHKNFQLILWRDDPTSPLKTYALNTVTFGTTSAPYLAVRTLHQLAIDEHDRFPVGAKCLKQSFYVDDFIRGADTLDEAKEIYHQTYRILKSGGFNLRKWSSNNPEMLKLIPEEDRETNSLLSFDDKLSVKTLGIHWRPTTDSFHYIINLANHKTHTKRTMLSDIAKIFDPLGWASPTIILAKIMIQELWLTHKEWDAPLSVELNTKWLKFRDQLKNLEDLKIERWLSITKESLVELHGFADASELAYGAVIYLKTNSSEQINVSLIISKTKVTPLKKISIPRLELNAAAMLAKLMKKIQSIFDISDSNCYCWSDSMITLAWIKDNPHKRTTYVANRVAEIQTLTMPNMWRHVRSKENPADLASRGILPDDLKNNQLWWHGPHFLTSFHVTEHVEELGNVELPPEETRRQKSEVTISLKTLYSCRKSSIVELTSNLIMFSSEQLNKFSTLNRLVNVVAYCLRFVRKFRPRHRHISPKEWEDSLTVIIRIVQSECFAEELKDLKDSNISRKSPICNLNPFVNNKDGLLRVGSRLGNAEHLSYDQKYPIIVPYKHNISQLIVRNAHLKTLHGTNQETKMLINQKYYIIRCSRLVKLVINRCTVCYRYNCKARQQQMGQLPKNRISPERPFSNTGVDFAGPFELKKWKGRCNSFIKAYFAIFVCFATKAIHLEVVEDLSTNAFVDAYRRFISRRGIVKNLYSDCGTNFIGAERTVTKCLLEADKNWSEEVEKELASFKTAWHFNPPGSPHFGGLWEAGVKTVKHHLKRIMTQKLTYSEFETVLVQIEACLNSRPLCKLKDDPNDLVITPAHFLVQDSLLAMPCHNLENNSFANIDRWSFLQKLLQNFWRIWNQDYLNSLRNRQKWRKTRDNVKIGDIVLINEPNLPPNQWLLGKILETHSGKDGLIRVVTIKTKNNTLKRPVAKISPLPIE